MTLRLPLWVSSKRCHSGSISRGPLLLLLTLLLISCWLVLISLDPLPAEDSGRYQGRPLQDLWAVGLPEQAWFSDPACRHLVTRFTRDAVMEVVRLASFPRSGNTWTRYLLEAATGVFTSAGGPDTADLRAGDGGPLNHSQLVRQLRHRPEGYILTDYGFLGDPLRWTQGNTIVSKFHNLPQPWPAGDGTSSEAGTGTSRLAAFADGAPRRAILLIRDPFKAMISLRKFSAGHEMHSDSVTTHRESFRGEQWTQFARHYAQHWYYLNTQWVDATNATLVVPYELLTRQPLPELQRMLEFLDVEPHPGRLACVRRHLEGAVHNHRHDVVPDDTTYPLALRAAVWAAIHQLDWHLKDRGRPGLPLHLYSFADQFQDIGL